ncbi:Uncharacterised protein [uncultured Comamonas sp.]|nr:Uncharacterised protein [uncultured Comamonas sp.]
MTTIVIEGAARITITPPTTSSEAMAAFERVMQKIGRADTQETQAGVREGTAVEIFSTTPPRIGQYWRGQGGIYAGIARGQAVEPDYHLILAVEAPETGFTWEAAKTHAKTIVADGHNDFALPMRFESALLYANLRDMINADHWHWTGTEHSAGRAFNQSFDDGYQNGYGVSFEARARFVRRLVL